MQVFDAIYDSKREWVVNAVSGWSPTSQGIGLATGEFVIGTMQSMAATSCFGPEYAFRNVAVSAQSNVNMFGAAQGIAQTIDDLNPSERGHRMVWRGAPGPNFRDDKLLTGDDLDLRKSRSLSCSLRGHVKKIQGKELQ